jgi:hypothetical protein
MAHEERKPGGLHLYKMGVRWPGRCTRVAGACWPGCRAVHRLYMYTLAHLPRKCIQIFVVICGRWIDRSIRRCVAVAQTKNYGRPCRKRGPGTDTGRPASMCHGEASDQPQRDCRGFTGVHGGRVRRARRGAGANGGWERWFSLAAWRPVRRVRATQLCSGLLTATLKFS